MHTPQTQAALPSAQVQIGSTTIAAEVAATPVAQEQGLSGRSALPDGTGMLFVFNTADRWGIWMKNMHFPLDIVWADAAGTIVTVERDVAPGTYPQVFYPDAPALYVVELPAGFAAKEGIAVGGKIVVK